MKHDGVEQEYRAYVIGLDGHIELRVDLVCFDDEAAKEKARRLVDDRDVELRQGERRIATFIFATEPFRQARRLVGGIGVISTAWRTGTAAGTGVRTLPRLVGMVLANPAGVIAGEAFHRRFSAGAAVSIRRHPLASVKAAIFLGGPVALPTPRLKVSLGALRQIVPPRRLERRAGSSKVGAVPWRSSPGF